MPEFIPEYIYSVGGKRYKVSANGGDVHLEWYDVPLAQEGDSLFHIEDANHLINALIEAVSKATVNRENITYTDYVSGIDGYRREHTGQRFGQAAFNYLSEVRPDISRWINTTVYDPFYADDSEGERIARFFNKVQELW